MDITPDELLRRIRNGGACGEDRLEMVRVGPGVPICYAHELAEVITSLVATVELYTNECDQNLDDAKRYRWIRLNYLRALCELLGGPEVKKPTDLDDLIDQGIVHPLIVGAC